MKNRTLFTLILLVFAISQIVKLSIEIVNQPVVDTQTKKLAQDLRNLASTKNVADGDTNITISYLMTWGGNAYSTAEDKLIKQH